MKLIKIITVASIMGLHLAGASQAHAAAAADDFEFSYNPALLSTQAGRVELKQTLEKEARAYCSDAISLRHAIRREQICTRAIIRNASAELADRHIVWNDGEDILKAEQDRKIGHRAYKALTPGLR